MFDIGFPELLIVALVLLLVVGPERLPEVLRTVGRVVGSARRSFDTLKAELEREVGADELRRELHNARIMEDAKRLEEDLKGAEQSFKALGQSTKAELTAAEDALRAPTAQAPASAEGEAEAEAEGEWEGEGEENAKVEAPKAGPAPQGELAFPNEGHDPGGKA
jgi:sec-independent protein translocase protein TatB